MKKELPEIFKKKVDKDHIHNTKVYYASSTDTNSTTPKISRKDNNSLTTVEEKIRKLLKSSRYLFNINVVIKTNKKEYNTKIAGKVRNSLVTVDGEVIPIIEIEDIIIKDRI